MIIELLVVDRDRSSRTFGVILIAILQSRSIFFVLESKRFSVDFINASALVKKHFYMVVDLFSILAIATQHLLKFYLFHCIKLVF